MNANFASLMKEKRPSRIATWLAFSLLPLSGFATDIYIPSLPSMGIALHTSNVQVQLTLTLFLISYGVSQLFIGSILDSFGRYKLSLVSLVVFAIASLVIALSHNIYLICLMRIVHGLTVAVIVVAKRAYFVDMFKGDELKHYLSMFTIIWSAGPIVAPFIGGYLEHLFGWQSNFFFLAALAATIAVLEWFFSFETLHTPVEFNLSNITNIYLTMIRTASFSLGIMMLSFAYAMIMVYNMTGPFIIEHQMHLTAITAGYCSLILGLAWMCGGFVGRGTIKLPFYPKLATNIVLQLFLALIMLLVAALFPGLATMILFAFVIQACCGFTYNNYFTYCLSRFPNYAGISGGMTGGVVYIMVSILSYTVVNFLPPKDVHNLGLSYLSLIILSGIVMTIVYRLHLKKTQIVQMKAA